MDKSCINKSYRVSVKVPLGVREGFLRLHICNESVTGQLELLGKVEKIEGNISSDGNMNFKGALKTPIRTLEYTAAGEMKDDCISLHLTSGPTRYALTGTLISEEEGEITE